MFEILKPSPQLLFYQLENVIKSENLALSWQKDRGCLKAAEWRGEQLWEEPIPSLHG